MFRSSFQRRLSSPVAQHILRRAGTAHLTALSSHGLARAKQRRILLWQKNRPEDLKSIGSVSSRSTSVHPPRTFSASRASIHFTLASAHSCSPIFTSSHTRLHSAVQPTSALRLRTSVSCPYPQLKSKRAVAHDFEPTSPNQALQRTAPAVTLAASCLRLSPTAQPSRQPPPSLSLGSLGN